MIRPTPPFIGRLHHHGYELPLWLLALDAAGGSSEHLRLLYLESGSCVVQTEAGQSAVTAPAIVLLASADRIEAPARARGVVLRFHPSVINAALSVAHLQAPQSLSGTVSQDAYLLRAFLDPALADRAIALDARANAAARSALAGIVREGTVQRDANWPCRTRAFLIELLFGLRLTLEQARPAGDDLFDRALATIHERLDEKVSVPELARLCGSNRSSLNAAFRLQTGRSVHAYVMQLRMEVAAALLRDTGLPISEILVRVGYENPSHFSRQFRALLGASPGAYRAAESNLPGPVRKRDARDAVPA
jgi:AraC-like DNA-binding protein